MAIFGRPHVLPRHDFSITRENNLNLSIITITGGHQHVVEEFCGLRLRGQLECPHGCHHHGSDHRMHDLKQWEGGDGAEVIIK
jgi:hypothetical protein